MYRSLFVLLAALMVMFAACGSDSEPTTTTSTPTSEQPTVPAEPSRGEIAGDEVVFVWTETGGCAMAGPNCARYVVTADGSVTTFRSNFQSFEEATSGLVTGTQLDEWINVASTTDLEDLQTRLGPGEVTAAFDGVDFVLEAPWFGHSIDSTQFEFDRGEPFFQAAFALTLAAAEAAPLELESR